MRLVCIFATFIVAIGCNQISGIRDFEFGDSGTDTDTDGNTDPEVGNLTGTITGFASTTPLPEMKVIALDNETAEPIPGQETISAVGGTVSFNGLPAGMVGFKVFGVPGQFVDTYNFNIRSNTKGETIWSMPFAIWELVFPAFEVVRDDTKGQAVGGLYWLDEDKNEYSVECGIVESLSGPAEVRYIGDNGLPVPNSVLDHCNRGYGQWAAANIDPGKVTIQGKVGGEAVGSTTFFAFPGAVSVGNIEVDAKFSENPGGSDKCE